MCRRPRRLEGEKETAALEEQHRRKNKEKKCFSGVQELHPSEIFQLKESIQSCNMAGRYNDGGYGGGGGGYGGR